MRIKTLFVGLSFLMLIAMESSHAAPLQGDGVQIVVIDAGHGGRDPGNLGTGRYKNKEKDIALAVSLKLGKYIEQNFDDVRVIYTRTTDVLIDLEERARIANRAGADLFISIHCDAFKKSSVHGSTSIVMGKDHDDDNMRIAQQENSVIFLEDNYEEKYEGFDPNRPESYIALTLYQNAFMFQSISFAQKVQDQFRERVKRRDRGVKQQPLMVTKMAVMPAVLVELGFLTNPTEEDFLNTQKGQDYMASAIYRAFKEYKMERESFTLEVPKIKTPQPIDTVVKDTIKVVNSETVAESSKQVSEPKTTEGVYYTVQIATSARKYDLLPKNFKGLEGVQLYESKGFYKYIVGRSADFKEMEALKVEVRKKGYKDAFVVALANGKRISLAEAKALLP